MKNSKMMKQRGLFYRGFTLLEMMMVMVIIAVLAGGVIAFVQTGGDDAKVLQADADFKTIEAKLMSYRSLAGRNPTDAQGLKALVTQPTVPPKPRRYPPGGYLKKVPNDPWGNPYIYKERGSKDASSYEIISYGKDGQEGGEDDLSSQD